MIFHNDSHLNNFVVTFTTKKKVFVRLIDADNATLGKPDTSVNISSANDTPENRAKGCYFDAFTYAASMHSLFSTVHAALVSRAEAEDRLYALTSALEELRRLDIPLYADYISTGQHYGGKMKSKISAVQVGALLKQMFMEFTFFHDFERSWGEFNEGIFGAKSKGPVVTRRLPF